MVEVARVLLDHGAFIDQRAPIDGQTPLWDATLYKRLPMVEFLLDRGADPDLEALGGFTRGDLEPFFLGEVFGPYREVIERQRRHRAQRAADPRLELDAQGPFNGYTALHDAIWHGHVETAQVYIEAGARVDLRALDGRTPIEMARDCGYPEIVEMLERAPSADGGR